MTPKFDPSAENRVEAYLDQLLVPLARNLSDFHREELRRELRAHLWGRVEAYRELGHSDEDAVTEALRQFGGANDFARQWRQEWTKTDAVSASTRRLWEAGKAALKPTLMGLTGAFLPFVAHDALGRLLTEPFGTVFFWSLAAFTFLLLPMLIGVRQGRRQPNAGTGMAAVLTAGIAAASLLYAAVEETAPDNLNLEGLCSILLALIVFWLPLASGAAAISGWWTRRAKAHQLA